jgi:hypothetical protein
LHNKIRGQITGQKATVRKQEADNRAKGKQRAEGTEQRAESRELVTC